MIRKIVGTSRSAKNGSIKTHGTNVKSSAGSRLSAKSRPSKSFCTSCQLDSSYKSKLRALKSLEGIWADKDTSFFDKKHA